MLNGYKKPRNLAVFISGNGSTLQTILEVRHQCNIVLIVTNKKNVYGRLKAMRFGVPVFFFSKSVSYDELDQILRSYHIQNIFLAGFMKVLPESFVSKWDGKITNIHPSLLPAHAGLNSIEKSWEDNADMGVTLHMVNQEVDAGKKILQQTSLRQPKRFSLYEASAMLRKTEQHLIREFVQRFYI